MTRFLVLVMGIVMLGLNSCGTGNGGSSNGAFGVAQRELAQIFSVYDIEPTFTEEEAQFDVKVFFTQPLSQEDALKIFEPAFVESHAVTVTDLGDRKFNFQLNNIPRQNEDFQLEVKLDGTPLQSRTEITKTLDVPARGVFKLMDHKVDKANSVVTLYFSQPLKQRNIDGFLSVSPEMGYRTELVGNQLAIYFDRSSLWDYQLQEVTLTVGSGIKDKAGNSLNQEEELTFDLTDLSPKVRWTEPGVIVPEVGDATIYFDAICLNSVTLRIVRVFNDNILSFYQNNGLAETEGIRNVGRLEQKVKIALDNPTPNQWRSFPIVLSDYIEVKSGDMFQLILDFGPADYAYATEESKLLTLEDDALETRYWDGQAYNYKHYDYEGDWNDPLSLTYYNWVEERKNVIITDLAITAKMGSSDAIDVFVFRISNTEPVSGAEVSAYNFQRQLVTSGRTDSQGHVQLSCDSRPAFVVAKNSGGQSIIKTSDGDALSYSKFDIGGEAVEKGVAAFAYSNRGVWRPGDELQLNLMVSNADGNLPDDYPVVMEVYDASNRLYSRLSNNSPMGGIYTFNVPTSPNDETGLWRASFKVGNSVINKYLRVETVKPNRLSINLNLPEVVSLRNPRSVQLHSQWLNGLIAGGLRAEIDVKVRQGRTTFENFPGYSFGNESEQFYPDEMSLFSGPLDGQGNATVGFGPMENLYADQMINATFTTKVFEQGGDFSVSSTTAKLSPRERYVGVELPQTESRYGSYYFTNRDWRFPVAVVKETGDLYNHSVSLDYQFYKIDRYWWWSSEDASTLQQYVNGSYKRPEQSGTLSCRNGRSELTLNVPDEKWGMYLLVINDQEGGNTFAKVLRFDWDYSTIHSTGESEGPVQLAMNTTKDTYNVGEQVVVNFPSSQNARALVTVEANDHIVKTMMLDNLGTDGQVEFEATEEMIPNVYVYVSLLQPRDAGNDMPLRMYGVVPVKVEDQRLHLQPVLAMPETSNTNKRIQVNVTEAHGKAMTYTLAIVDEGILGLTNYNTPDPYGYFNAKQALKVRTWDNYDYVIDAFSGELGTVYAIGGDGYINQEVTLDKRFKAFAVTYGPFELQAGSHGNTHEIEVPQCSGALRFMVVAKGEGKSFGAAEKQMTVVDPITLYPSAPRVAAPGDELNLKVQVITPELRNKNLTVRVNNQNLVPVGNLPTSVRVNENGEGMLSMRVKVPEIIGIATMDVTVSNDGFEAQTVTEIPIRMPYAEKRRTYTLEIGPNATETLNFDLQGMNGTQQGNITVASLIPVDFYGRLHYLSTYPYGCLEQVVSSAFPQLYFNYFIQQDEASMARTRAAIEAGIASIKSYQKPDFSLTNWVGGTYSDPWTEIYALHFLSEAKNQGFDVPDYLYDGLVRHQAEIARNWSNNPDFRPGETIQAYRLFVLALAGVPEMGALNRFKELEMHYSLSSVLTAATYAQVGRKTTAQRYWPNLQEGASMSDYYTSFGSTTRDLAFLTYSEMLCDKDELVRTHVNDLCEILNSDRWLDTQSTAFALFVLGKYAEKVGATNAPVAATVKFNGEERSVSANVGSVAYAVTPRIGANTVEVTNTTDQQITVKVFTKAAVAEYETQESGNFIRMNVNYFDKNGAALNPASLPMGKDFSVSITVENPSSYRVTELALAYYLASGWEIVNDRLTETGSEPEGAKHFDIRDDRAYFFFDLAPRQRKTFTLKLNATYQGSFMLPAVRCEDMYNNEIYYMVPARPVEVR